ncbi:MAG: MFS transporter [Conexivisphaerales archaeon]
MEKYGGGVFKALDESKATPKHFEITILSAMGTFLDGYDISIIGVALTIITTISSFQYAATPIGKGLMAASTTIGMLIAGLAGGYLADLRGRRFLYLWDMVVFILFTALISLASGFWDLFAYRLILGLAIGADYAISPTIISEISPVKPRGKLLAINTLMWWVGAAVAYAIGFALLPMGTNSWRYMFAIGLIPAVVVLILRRTVPESARWLAMRGNLEKAKESEEIIVGKSDDLKSVKGEKVSLLKLFSGKYIKWTIFFGLAWFAYDVAFYGIGLFNPYILELLGLTHRLSVLGSAVFAAFAIIGSVLCVLTVDVWGRKLVTALGFLGMSISLLVLAYIGLTVPREAFTVGSIAVGIVAMFVVFEIFQAWGFGTTDFIYGQELFPTSARSTGQGWGTTISRIGAVLGLTTFPSIVAIYGIGYGLLFFGVFAILGLLLTLFMAPETRGRALEEITSG